MVKIGGQEVRGVFQRPLGTTHNLTSVSLWFLSQGHGKIKPMKSKREGLVPIGEVFSDLDGPVAAIGSSVTFFL